MALVLFFLLLLGSSKGAPKDAPKDARNPYETLELSKDRTLEQNLRIRKTITWGSGEHPGNGSWGSAAKALH